MEPAADPAPADADGCPAVVIVGGGLAGLTVAWRLHRAGVAFRLIEARERLGGRILTVGADGAPAHEGFDLGPSWFWPAMHPGMARVVSALGLAAFEQAGEGAMLFERTATAPPERYPAMRQEPAAMRLVGGTGALITALAARLPRDRIGLGVRATRIARADPQAGGAGATLHAALADGTAWRIEAAHVVCALPPRLLAATVTFDPAPDAATLALWAGTPTWMAPHAKFLALYPRPFWREAGLSGMAQSRAGPLVEIHDAGTADGQAALFGFVGVPAPYRMRAGREAVIAASVEQLGRLFGPEALPPLATLYHDWAADGLTAIARDQTAGDHPAGGRQDWSGAAWRDCLLLAGSETALRDPGYLAGAIEAGERAATILTGQLASGETRKA